MLKRIRLPYFAVLTVLSLSVAQSAMASRRSVTPPTAPGPVPAEHAPEAPSTDLPTPSPSPRLRDANELVFPLNFDKLSALLKKGESQIGRTQNLEFFGRLPEDDIKPEDFKITAAVAQELDKRVTTLREYIQQLKDCGTPFTKSFAQFLELNLINPLIESFGRDFGINQGQVVYTLKTAEELLATYAKAHPEAKITETHAKIVSNLNEIASRLFGKAGNDNLKPWIESHISAATEGATVVVDGMAIMKAKMEKEIADGKESNEAVCPLPTNVPAAKIKRSTGLEDDSDKSDDSSPDKTKLKTAPLPPSSDPVKPVDPKDPKKPVEKTAKEKALEKLQEFYGMVKNVMSQQEAEQSARDAKMVQDRQDVQKKLADLKKDKERDAEAEAKAKADEEKKKKKEDQLRELQKAKKEQPVEKPHQSNPPAAPAGGGDDDSAPRKLAPAPAAQANPGQGAPGQGQGQGPMPSAGGASPSGAEAPTSSEGAENRFANGADGANVGLVQPLAPAQVSSGAPVGGNNAVSDFDKTMRELRSAGVGNQSGVAGRPNANQSMAQRLATGGGAAPYNAPGVATSPLGNPATFGGANGLAVGPAGARAPIASGLNRPQVGRLQ